MFRTNQRAVPEPHSVCLVGPLTAGLATSVALAQTGWRVHILATGHELGSTTFQKLEGVTVAHLNEMNCPSIYALDGPNCLPLLHQSDKVRLALAELHKRHRFACIEFFDRVGLAFRSVQAKRLGLAFADVPLMVRLSEPTQLERHRQRQWQDQPDDLAEDYAERYAFEHADGRLIDDASLIPKIHKLGWEIRSDARVLPRDAVSFAPLAPVLGGEGPGVRGRSPRKLQPPHPNPESPSTGERGLPSDLVEVQTAFPPPTPNPLVTVSVAYYNLAPYLVETLASLATQTYPSLEVFVINDGSTDAEAVRVFQDLRERYADFQFLEQANAGIGATRNRGLELARGKYFLPVDADNVATPDMVARLVTGLERNPDLAALTCYFLAFQQSADLDAKRFCYAYKPTGGPHVLGCLRNVYGDGNALFRTSALRAIGGFTTDRDTSWEDWEVFVKLVNAGQAVDVLPEFLFYYRHRDAGFSRVTDGFLNHQRVLRQYVESEGLPRAERLALWNLLVGLHRRVEQLEDDNRTLEVRLRSKRYQVIDRLGAAWRRFPALRPTVEWLWNRWTKKAKTPKREARTIG